MKSVNVATRIHGRVLVREVPDPSAVVLGFHGYMENADLQMARLESIPGADVWTLLSVQALHRFYRGRSEEVVASWMTRQDRDDMIADNIEYLDRIVETLVPAGARIITLGFSQGAAMAFRAAVRGQRPARGIVSIGGDVPPELLADPAATFPRTLLARGERDEWYTAARMAADVNALRARSAAVQSVVYASGHDWTPEVAVAAAAFIAE